MLLYGKRSVLVCLRNEIRADGYDACHVPPNFDSAKGVYVYFLFDIGVMEQADLSLTPHYIHFASRTQGDW